MKRLFVLALLTLFNSICAISQPNAWINEFHYDNVGTDAGEFVEVVIEDPGNYDLTDFELYLYNGNGGGTYGSAESLDGFDERNTEGNFTFYTFTYSVDGIQNGAPDGLALIYQGAVINGQFISYEGTLTASNGPANGLTSVDIGVSESGTTPIGHSLQLAGTGLQYSDFSWNSPDFDTPGSINICQLLSSSSVVNLNLVISEVANPEDVANAKFVELYNSGTTSIDFCRNVWYLSCESNGGSQTISVRLDISASLAPGETWVIAGNNPVSIFQMTYGFIPDQISNIVSGSGDDSYMLYYGGDHTTGILIDIYGEIGTIGTNELWQYDNSKATRKKHIVSPNNVWTSDEWVIIPATASEMTPDWHDKDLTWNGGSIDWNIASNWTDGGSNSMYAPDAGCDITIPNLAIDPVISGRASTNNMEIESNAVVTIEPTHFLVTGSEINNQSGTGGLIVKSDASGDGMLLLGSGTTQATIERYLSDDMSHFISAPTTNATADDLFQDHDPEVYLYEFHESDETYHYLVPTSTPMPSGKGFSTWVEDFTPDYIVAEFDGNLMSSDLTLNTSTIPAMSYTYIAPPNDTLGFNLLGNPYPIPISWKKGSWAKSNVEYTIWIWEPFPDATADEPDGQWLVTTTSGGGNFNGVVPSGQAFLVRASASGPSITIPADARTVYYPSTTYYKSREDDNDSSTYAADYVTIKTMNDQDEEEIWISFNEYGTEDFDNGWDASKLRNSYSTVCLYIPKESRDQCIEHLPTLYPDEERIVEIGFETTTDGEHSLIVDATYLPDTDITLEDMKYNKMQNMDADSIYTFVAFTDDEPNRFRVHFNKAITGIEFEGDNQLTDVSIQIYSYGKNVYIKKEDAATSGLVMLFDMYGREVISKPLEYTNLMKIPVQLSNNYLVAKVISNNKVFTSKVYIK